MFTNSFEYIVRRDGEITVMGCGLCGGGGGISLRKNRKINAWIAESSHDRRHDKLLHGSRCLRWITNNSYSVCSPSLFSDHFCQSLQNAWSGKTNLSIYNNILNNTGCKYIHKRTNLHQITGLFIFIIYIYIKFRILARTILKIATTNWRETH